MIPAPRFIRGFVMLAIVSLVLHVTTSIGPVTYIPAPLLLAILTTWLVPHLRWLLLVVALASEFLATTTPGLMALVMLVPLGIYLLRRSVEIDLSFSFAMLLGVTVAAQLAVFFLGDLLFGLRAELTPGQLLTFVPWRHVALQWISCTAAAYLLCLAGSSFIHARTLRR
jgi:hypothetical protein